MSFVRCIVCKKSFYKTNRRLNEANKFGWKFYCSLKCQIKGKQRGENYVCFNPYCKKIFYRAPAEVCKSKNIYCSQSCAATINNIGLNRHGKIKNMNASIEEYFLNRARNLIKVCPTCGTKFSGNKKYCSKKCIFYPSPPSKGKSKYTREIIIQTIKKFALEHGRIPVKREFTAGYKATRTLFGNWNNAIIAAGFDPNPILFAKHYIAEDGHKCDSFAEKIIDDYLHRRNIRHETNYPYPGKNKLTVDFKIKNIWIEFFGLSGELKNYDRLKRMKQRIAKKYGLKFVEIYPKDLFPKGRLIEIFKPYKELNKRLV